MSDAPSERPRRARPLLVAAIGGTVLFAQACVSTTSGNLIAPPYDLRPGPDMADSDAAVDGGAADAAAKDGARGAD